MRDKIVIVMGITLGMTHFQSIEWYLHIIFICDYSPHSTSLNVVLGHP